MNKKEKFIKLIRSLPEEKVVTVFDLIADELIPHETVESNVKQNERLEVEKNGYILLNYTAVKDITVKRGDTLSFKYGTITFAVEITANTFLQQGYFLQGDELRIIGFIEDEKCIAHAVVIKSYFELFRAFSSIKDKAEAMMKYTKLPENTRQSIARQMDGKRYSVAENSECRLTDMQDLRFKFEMTRDTYTPQQQMDICGMFDDVRKHLSTNKQRAEKKLTYILNIDQVSAPDITLTKNEILDGLNACLYRMDAVKEKLAEAIVAAKYAKKKGFAILLVGSPGVGKTTIMKAIAKILDRPYFVVPMGSSTSMVDIIGDAPHYEASDSGEVVKNYYKVGTTTAVVGLDEYDKAYDSQKEGGKISKAFNDALSDEAFFKDAFLGTYINVANTIFIASANSTDTISENLLNRFTVIHVPDYTEEEKIEIAKRFIIPEIFEKYAIGRDEIHISDSVLSFIADSFCEDDGARDMKKHIDTLVGKILTEWDQTGHRQKTNITKEFVTASLEKYVNEDSPAILYRRNKMYFTAKVDEEISSLRAKLRKESLSSDEREKYEKALDYLLRLVPIGNAFSEFDEKVFYEQVNKTHYGMDEVKKTIAQIFYISSINNRPLTSNRILLVGPPGVGKTSIVKSIAAACGAKYDKISLNGVSDEHYIKGFPRTYIGSDAGAPVKACRRMGTTKGILQLDEIDKLVKREGSDVSNALIDLLDDSAEYTDMLLGVPVNLSNMLFIATANDLSAVSPLIRDRFTVINLEGYTEAEKRHIIKEYVVPNTVSELCPKERTLSFSDEAIDVLIETYCRSFGVRDADRTTRKIVKDKLYSARNSHEVEIVVTGEDVRRILGSPGSERGNYPAKDYPGLSRGLAVTGDNCGMSFAIETMLVPDETGLTITGLPKESTIDSVKLAISYVKRMIPGCLKDKGVHIHFGEGAVVKDGPSAGVAILMSLISAIYNKPIEKRVAYTGEINGNGYVFNIGGTIAKIQAAEQSGCTHVYIPKGNYAELKDSDISQFKVNIVPVEHISEVLTEIFPRTEYNEAV